MCTFIYKYRPTRAATMIVIVGWVRREMPPPSNEERVRPLVELYKREEQRETQIRLAARRADASLETGVGNCN